MKVSVIIPAYNVEKYLSKSLDSVINQVYKNLEIIVIDDASTDNTKNIIMKYAKKDNRIIPFYQTVNKGVSTARNIGLKAATGDYIIFVDSDDFLTKDAIRRMIDVALEYNSDFIDSYHLLYLYKKNGKVVSFTEKKLPKEKLILGSLDNDIRILDMYTYVTGKLIKKDLLKDLYFDESLSRYEDMVFEHELKLRVKNYVFLNKIVYYYYQREDSLINTFGKKHICYMDALKKVNILYANKNKKIRNKIEAILFQNMIFTLFTKIVKNDDSIEENAKLCKSIIEELITIFPNYENNSEISKPLKKSIKKVLNNEKKLRKTIKKMKKINFIKLYFKYLSIFNKYKGKNI